eukprot:TRINITY_DN2632_c0_g2_i4.p1 TRINITY_DN2632_c0_g2~~TRINITY_DN2632_c0_g2_i4.p1  ORF type:complete len:475 (+),score=107.85 TRINITY_DN2632_c0_g2_i4:833-2257(+)
MLSPNPYDCIVNTPPICLPTSSSPPSSPSSSSEPCDMDSISPRSESTTPDFILNHLQQQLQPPLPFAAISSSQTFPSLPLPSFVDPFTPNNNNILTTTPLSTPKRFSIPLPDQTVFEEPTSLSKKQKRSPPPTFRTAAPKCPKTPLRTPQRPSLEKERQFKTDLKRRGSCSNHFEFLEKLGEGSFGIVFKVRKDGNYYAIKKSKNAIWNTIDRNQQLKELGVIKLLGSHPNIIKMSDAWEEGGHIYIQTELCENGSLCDLMERTTVPEESIWRYLNDILQGLSHIHAHNIMHLDIKPENLLLSDDNRVLIADFGISAKTTSSSSSTEGDRLYMAPELLEDKFSSKADIFSLGITIFEMATGYSLPPNGQLWRDLRQGMISFPEDKAISQELVSLITQMMHPDPNMRPTAEQLLTHPKIFHIHTPFSNPSTPNALGGSDSSCTQEGVLCYATRCPAPLLSQANRNSGRRKLCFGN